MLFTGNVDDWLTPEDLAGGEIAKPHLGRSGSIVTTSPRADSSESSSRYLQGDVIATNANKTAAMYVNLDMNLCVDDFTTGDSYMVSAEDGSLVDFAELLNVAFDLGIRFSGNEIYEDFLMRLV